MLKLPKYSSAALLACILVGACVYYYVPSLTPENITWLGNFVGGGLLFLEAVIAFWFVWRSAKKAQ